MNAETRTLVRSALDASDYTRGAQQVVAANDRISASGDAVAASAERQTVKLREGGGAFERLQRGLDAAYRAQQEFERAQRQINAEVERGTITQQRAAQLTELAAQKFLGLASASETAAAAARQQAAAAEAAAQAAARAAAEQAQSAARAAAEQEQAAARVAAGLAAVEARYDSATVAQRRHADAITAIAAAQRGGLITTQRAYDLTLAVERGQRGAGQAAQAFAVANDNATRSTGRFGQVLGQAGFQIQDVATQIAMGQNALVSFGTQFAQFAGFFGTAGAIAGAVVITAILAARLLGLGDAAEALNKAIDAQADFYKQANEAAELYRGGLDREAEAILRLGNLYASYSTERRRAEELRLGDQQAELARQQAALGARAQGALPGGIQNMIDQAASRSARGQGIGAGAAEISPQLRDALTAIMEFRAVSDQVSSESLSRLSTRLQEAAASASGDLAPSLLRAATQLRSMLPDSDRLEASLRQNATQMDALRTGTDGAGTSLGSAASAARLLAENLRRVQEIAAANPALGVQQEAEGLRRRLDALRSGGTAGEEAEARRLENERRAVEATNKAYEDQLKRLLDLGQARAQAEEGARTAAATVGQEVMRRNELAETLHRETEARKTAEREAEQAGRRAERREETEARRAQRARETEERRDQERQARANTEHLNRIEEENRRTTDDIVRYGSDAFADMFEQNGRGWQGMLDTFASTFRRLMARMAAEAILRPIIAPIVSGLGLGGSTSGGVGGLGDILGVGGSINSLTGGGLSGMLGLTGGSGSFLTDLGLSTGLFGNGISPLAQGPLVSGETLGTLSQSGFFGTTTLGSTLGVAGLGFMGGSLLAGAMGGNSTGGGFGGAGGAAAGFLLSGGNPLVALLAGAAGGALGGLFGGKENPPFYHVELGATDGRLAVGGVAGKRAQDQMTQAEAQAKAQVEQVNAALAAAGLNISGSSLIGKDQADPNRPLDLAGAIPRFLFSSANMNVDKVVGGRAWSSIEEVTGAAQWVTQIYDALSSTATPAEQFATQIKAVNDNFAAAITQAEAFGLATDKLAVAQRRATDTLKAQREAGILSSALSQSRVLGDFLAGMARGTGSAQTQFGAAQEQFSAALEAARLGGRGADLSRVTGAAQALLQANASFNASGSAAATVEGMVRSSLANLGVSLDLPGFADNLDASINRWGEAQVDELKLLRDSNTAMHEELRTLNLRIGRLLAA